MTARAILWRRLDAQGCDGLELRRGRSGTRLEGTALFSWKGRPCRLEYAVVTDAAGRTRRGTVKGRVGGRPVSLRITADSRGRWRLNGRAVPSVAGCADLDLNFTPATNSLPLLRLGLRRGQEAAVRSAWLRFPDFVLRPLDQRYRRTGPGRYRYESAGFRATLEVAASGLVLRYGSQWRVLATSSTDR